MKKFILLLNVVMLLMSNSIFAQLNVEDTNSVQFTFVYPIGSNGYNSYKTTNILSWNVIIGLNGGVEGFEVGGVGNLNNGNVNGCQFAGTTNITNGDVKGAQFSGVFNLTNGSVFGAQFSGVFNANSGNYEGFQTAGVFNLNKGNFKDVQIAGTFNSNIGKADGLQIAGVFNSNICHNDKDSSNLVQISGVINQNSSNFKGAQISGTLNVSTDSMTGVQIGVVNVAKYIKGVQIGVVNVCAQGSDVIPIGLLNIVPKGLHEVEFAAGDLIYSNLNVKLGVNKFYTIYKSGLSYSNNDLVYSLGLGVGSYIRINDKNRLSIEVSSNNISDLRFESVDMLTKLDLNYHHNFSKHFSFFAGPSINNYVSYIFNENENPVVTPLYSFSSYDRYSTKIYNWVGLNAGISFNF